MNFWDLLGIFEFSILQDLTLTDLDPEMILVTSPPHCYTDTPPSIPSFQWVQTLATSVLPKRMTWTETLGPPPRRTAESLWRLSGGAGVQKSLKGYHLNTNVAVDNLPVAKHFRGFS